MWKQKAAAALTGDRAIDGSIVIASIDDELTVKRLRKRNGRITLEPENDDYRSLHIAKDMELTIWGVVVKVIHDVEVYKVKCQKEVSQWIPSRPIKRSSSR